MRERSVGALIEKWHFHVPYDVRSTIDSAYQEWIKEAAGITYQLRTEEYRERFLRSNPRSLEFKEKNILFADLLFTTILDRQKEIVNDEYRDVFDNSPQLLRLISTSRRIKKYTSLFQKKEKSIPYTRRNVSMNYSLLEVLQTLGKHIDTLEQEGKLKELISNLRIKRKK